MKKLTILLLSILLIFTCISCKEATAPTWVLNKTFSSYEYNVENLLDPESPASLMGFNIKFNEDGLSIKTFTDITYKINGEMLLIRAQSDDKNEIYDYKILKLDDNTCAVVLIKKVFENDILIQHLKVSGVFTAIEND